MTATHGSDALVTDRGPFAVEVLGKTIRVIDFAGGDVFVVGRVTRPGARSLAESIAALLNDAREGLGE